jgi:shikimate kinase
VSAVAPRIILVGAPGAGKTTVGLHLAERLDVQFRDTDADVERSAGRSISDIFVEDGEPAFRERERAAVRAALEEHDGVLALGGGAVTDEQTRAALRDQSVVWLRVGLAAAASRVGLNRDRPLLLGNVRSNLKRLMEARAPLYAEVSDHIIDTDGASPEEITDRILEAIGTTS